MVEVPLDPVPDSIGPYKILGVLGEGGMGTVYVAEQREPVRRRVAIKVIKLGMDTKTILSRFEAERQALAIMEHGGIARIYDCGTTERGQPFFAMEHVKGQPITKYCDENRLDIRARIALFIGICSAVQHAHNKGVIHRDLTPSNVLVTVVDDKPHIKIIDFGLARATDHRLTEATIYTEQGQIVGTPEYMSPEQAGLANLDIDTRSDIYTLGVLLYELLVGMLPISREDLRRGGLVEMQRIIREVEPPKPSTRVTTAGGKTETSAKRRKTDARGLLRRVRGDLDWVVMQALEKDRTRRYVTPSSFAEDLQRYLDGEPVFASPPTMWYLTRKFAHRYQKPVAIGVAMIVLLTGGIVGTTYYLFEARAQAAMAEKKTSEAVVHEQRARDAKERADREHASVLDFTARFERMFAFAGVAKAGREIQAMLETRPPEVERIRTWLRDRGTYFEKELSAVRALLHDIEKAAFPQSADDRARDERSHPRYWEYRAIEKKTRALERAMRTRMGKPHVDHAIPEGLSSDLPKLNGHAWSMVDPDRKPQDHGQEELGLAIALHVVRLADRQGSSNRHVYLDTLAWALFATGLNERAKKRSAEAWKAAPADGKPEYRGYQDKLSSHVDTASSTLSKSRAELRSLASTVLRRRDWRFPTERELLFHETLLNAEVALADLTGNRGPVARLRQKLRWAESLGKLSTDVHASRWRTAIDSIRAADGKVASTLYARAPIELKPQLGLVPIGMNPKSRLWEFYHLRSAVDTWEDIDPKRLKVPEHDTDGSLQLDGDSGMVFVLIPGGRFSMGAQNKDPGSPGYDRWAGYRERPVHEARIGSFFVSRYEMTQGQWMRLTGNENPSAYKAGHKFNKIKITLRNPVESVSWLECTALTAQHGLALPATAQWEYACRAGTTTPWFTGASPESLAGFENILDLSAVMAEGWARDAPFEDGHVSHAPVGSFKPNGFGLHDMHGNVMELCHDKSRFDPTSRISRGGSYAHEFAQTRTTFAWESLPKTTRSIMGLRPVRPVRR